MTTYALGSNCHMTLQHDLINSGAPYGFILEHDTRDPNAGPAVSIQKQIDSSANVTTRAFFSVLLGDNLINPDGTNHTDSRSAMYAMLLLFLAKPSGLSIECSAGILSNLCSLGHVSTEAHFFNHSIVTCQLTDVSVYYPPADPSVYNLSVWDGGINTWAASYWRNTIIQPPFYIP